VNQKTLTGAKEEMSMGEVDMAPSSKANKKVKVDQNGDG